MRHSELGAGPRKPHKVEICDHIGLIFELMLDYLGAMLGLVWRSQLAKVLGPNATV